MSDVVPPGGERPIDDEPWPAAAPPSPTPIRLPAVPGSPPADVASPPDWRTLVDGDRMSPPGYRTAGSPAFGGEPRLDSFGLAACIVAVVGFAQLLVVPVPFVALLATALGLSGRRLVRLDPDGMRLPVLSTIGVAIGVAGVVAGIATILVQLD